MEEYLRGATERIIRAEVFGDVDEAEEQPETSAGLLAARQAPAGFAN